ncbi:MAG TPA: GNAT family N-acetyltransferase [Acidobacteriota bacterium]|nr:GNAT family N-acetyltransferase [Acidobacteriota bacterium]
MKLRFQPLTAENWDDLVALFGERGACGGCWCMFWHQSSAEYRRLKGKGNRAALRKRLKNGANPGIIAYVDDEPVGWCAVEPRDHYKRLESSRALKPIDQQPVWSITCFFVKRGHRHQGVTVALLKAALDHIQRQKGRIAEGYPTEPKSKTGDSFVYSGLVSAFRKAGFSEVARPSATRAIMRKSV